MLVLKPRNFISSASGGVPMLHRDGGGTCRDCSNLKVTMPEQSEENYMNSSEQHFASGGKFYDYRKEY